ncbi:MAG: methyl-accepting chemotaxis protein, partial [Bacillota bacterium]
MKISQWLKVATVIILSLLILVGGSVYYLNTSFRQERKVVENRENLKRLGNDMLTTVNQLSSLAYKYVQTADKKYANQYLKIINETKKRDGIIVELKQENITTAELELVQEAVTKSDFMIQLEKAAIEAVDNGNIRAAKRKLYDPYYSRRKEAFQSAIAQFQEQLDQRTAKLKNLTQNKANLILFITTILIILIAIGTVITFIFLYQKLTTSINKAVKFANQIANGNLDALPLKIDSNDEIAELSISLNRMQSNLKSTISRILELGQNLASYCEDINKVDQKIAYTSEFVKNVEQGNHKTITAIEEINFSIKGIVTGTEKLLIKAEDISNLGQNTFGLVTRTDDKISFGEVLVNQAVEVMEELSVSITKVDQISEKIMNLADETNLLSLDGAIAAAEEGNSLGFAYVADDIKELADESIEAVLEVKEIVREVKRVANKAIEIMIPTGDKNKNISMVFKEIGSLSHELTAEVEKMTESTIEQVESTKEISSAT